MRNLNSATGRAHRRAPTSQRRFAWVGLITILTLLLSFFPQVVPGAPVSTAEAHNLNASAVYVYFDPNTQAYLDGLIASNTRPVGTPLLVGGEELGIILKAIPDEGTTTGVGGYTTFYVPNGLQVIDAAYIMPGDLNADGITGFDKVPMKGQAQMPAVGAGGGPTVNLVGITRGPNILNITSPIVGPGNVNLGTLPGVYGDTGIFYSTAPETAFGSYYPGDPAPLAASLTNNSGDPVGFRTILKEPLNKWDAWQMAAYGLAGTTNPAYPSAALIDSNQRGYAPWGLANVVAGPQSGYAWEFDFDKYVTCDPLPYAPSKQCIDDATKDIGPWQRIKYPGSQFSDDPPGANPPVQPYSRGADASNSGWDFDLNDDGTLDNPLPQTTGQTNSTPVAVRWAYGQQTQYRPEYMWIKVKVHNPTAILDATGCPKWTVDTFGGDAGGDSGGKDHIWRYYDPNSVQFNGCLAIGKPATRELVKVGDTYQYKVKLYNAGAKNFSTVQIQDTLPGGVTYVSAVPAPSNVTLPNLTWTVAPFMMSQMFEATVTVKAASAGLLTNNVCATGTISPPPAQPPLTVNTCGKDVTVAGNQPLLRTGKSVTPTSVSPGGAVAYTLNVLNVGSGPSGSPVVLTEYLPAGFSYAGNLSTTVNGASVTAAVSGTAAQPVFSVPAAIQPNQGLVLKFDAAVALTASGGTYCNSFRVSESGINQVTGALACVKVSKASIGDTVYRDWNNNNQQDAGEEGIAGVEVCATGPSPSTAKTCAPPTDANGKYLINGLQPGSYTMSVTNPPAGYTPTQVAASPITLAEGDNILTADYGYKPGGTGSIGDTVWDDINGDGVLNGAEAGIANVTVNLYEDTNGNGAIDAGDLLITSMPTGAGGIYSFAGLATGLSYIVDVDETDLDLASHFNPNPFVATTPNLRAVSNLTSTPYTTADFGYKANLPGSIGDTVCRDTNSNKACDPGEPGIPNITVWLFRDADGDGLPDAGELVTTTSTDAAGKYLFPGLGPDKYVVVVDKTDPQLPSGYIPEIELVALTLSAGQNVTTADFPFIPLISKSVDLANVNPGGTLNFTVNVNYTGSDMLTNARVVDPVPAGLSSVTNFNMGGGVGNFVPQAAVDGLDDQGDWSTNTKLSGSPDTLKLGSGNITVSMVITSSNTAATPANITNVTPTLAIDGGGGACGAPTPPSGTLPKNGSLSFSFTCTPTTIGEFTFTGSAVGTITNPGDYEFAQGVSDSTLVSKTGSSQVITWLLGSNDPGTPGVVIASGTLPGIYAFQGDNTIKFWRYETSLNSWTDAPADNVKIQKGGALTYDGTYIYGFQGRTKLFYRYTIGAPGSWTARASLDANSDEGGALQYLDVGGTKYIFATLGNSNRFRRYAIGGNTWSIMFNTPANVKKGGALTTDGTYIYALQGDTKTGFWRCNATTDNVAGACSGASGSWTVLAPIPLGVGWGGSLTRIGNYIYAMRGNNTQNFYRYEISTNTWTSRAATPLKVQDGGALTNDGTYVYAFQGKTNGFWRYDPATNTWASKTNALGVTNQGGALVFVPGTGSADRTTQLSATPMMVNTGGTVTLVMELESNANIATVTPTAPTFTVTGGASATCGSPPTPTPASQAMTAGVKAYFTWTCTVTTGTVPGTVYFTAGATGTGGANFNNADSNTVIAIKPLTFQGTVSNPVSPTGLTLIENYATISDSGVIPSTPSNTTQTALGKSIGDFVWADLDGDGMQDAGEPGIRYVKVCIDANSNGACDPTEQSTTTNSLGIYALGGLSAGTYKVIYDLSTAPGYVPSTPTSVSVTLNPGDVFKDTADFGLRPPGQYSIGDTVWLDSDNNGSQNGTEPGLSGVTVKLYADIDGNGSVDPGEPLLATQVTDASGAYLFPNLPNGDYVVAVDESATVTSPYNGNTDIATGMDPTTGTFNPRSVSVNNANVTNADFGYNWSGSIGDYIWWDNNRNQASGDPATPEAGENPIAGATVLLYNDADNNGVIEGAEWSAIAFTDTGTNGKYLFDNLPPGHYLVDVYEDSFNPVPGKRVTVPTTPDVRDVDLTAGQDVVTADFGYYIGAAVEGNVFWDEDHNGVLDPAELDAPHLLENVTVSITCLGPNGAAGGGDDYSASMDTGTGGQPDGHFRFLAPVPSGPCTLTYETADTDAKGYPEATMPPTPPTPPTYSFVAQAGEDWHPSFDFGVDNKGQIGDTVWYDTANFGVQDPGEPGLEGVTVSLILDVNNDDQWDPDGVNDIAGDADDEVVLAAQATDPNGNYLFVGLADGNYVVVVNAATLPGNLTATYDNTGAYDGTGEAGISGGNEVKTVDFGYNSTLAPASLNTIGGRVYNDKNNNGAYDPNGVDGLPNTPDDEVGFPNVDVTVVCDYATFSVKTNASGAWVVGSIPDGTVCTVLDADESDLPRSDYVATDTPPKPPLPPLPITVTSDITGLNFGYNQRPGSISGTVCAATDGDGLCQPTGEPGIATVLITLKYAGDDGILGTGDDQTFTKNTDTNGDYSFTDLEPGLYQIAETNPSGYVSVADRDGGNPDNISVNLLMDQDKLDQDFEDIPPPGLDLTKTLTQPAGGVAKIGDSVVFRITVKNTGLAPIVSLTIADTYDAAKLQFVSATVTPSAQAAGSLTWNTAALTTPVALLPLASNATLTIDVTFTAKASAYPQATRNDVVASGTDSQNNPVPEKTAHADVQIIRPAIGVAKSVASIHNNGNNTYNVVYDLVVENLGDVDLNGVQVTDNLGDTFTGSGGVSGVSVTSVGFTTNASYNGLSNTDLLAAGQTLLVGQVKTIRLTVTVTPGGKMGTYNNQATATGTGPGAITVTDPSDNGADPDPDGDNNANEIGENDPTPVHFSENPAIGIAKSVASVKDNGSNSYTVVYTLLVENLGDVALTNVQVTDNLAATFPTPATFTAVSASSTDFTVNAGYNGGASPTPNTNLLAAGQTLAVGQTKLIQVTVTVNNANTATTYNNQAVATGTSPLSPVGAVVSDPSDNGVDPDPDGDRNANEPGENDPTPVRFSERPAIGAVKKLVSSTSGAGGVYTVVYDIQVKNLGTVALSNVQVTDNLAATFAGATGWAVGSVTSADFTVNWTAGPPPTGYNGGASPTPDINLLAAGQTLAVSQAKTIRLTVTVTPGSNLGPYNNQAIATGTSPIGTAVGDLSDDYTTPPAPPPAEPTDPDGDGNPNEPGENDPTPVTFTERAVIGVAKSVVAVTDNGNSTYTVIYDLVVENLGDVALSNVQVTDDLTATFVGATGFTANSVTSPLPPTGFAGNVNYNGGKAPTPDTNLLAAGQTLAVGQVKMLRLTVTVTPGQNMGPYNNQAVAAGSSPSGARPTDPSDNGIDPDPDGDGSPNEPGENDPTPVLFSESPAIGVAKSVAAITGPVAGVYTVVYNLVVQNLGTVPLSNVQVTDNLAATFAGATSFTFGGLASTGFTVNNSYNGGASPTPNVNLLAAGQTLAVGQIKSIQITVNVTPGSNLGPYNNQATGVATSPAGTVVSDPSDNGVNPDPNGNNNANELDENDPTPVSFTEIPAIGAAKRLAAAPTANPDGTYIVVYDILVKNLGFVALNNVQVTDDLAATFAAAGGFAVQGPPVITAPAPPPAYSVNAGYNGSTDINLLQPGQMLGFGSSVTIRVTVKVTPAGFLGPYNNQATVSGVSPAGTTVGDLSDDSATLNPDPNPGPNGNGNASDPGENDPTPVTFTENPQLGVAKTVFSQTNNGDGTFTVVYDLVVENLGNVVLSSVQVADNLVTTFPVPATFVVNSVTSAAPPVGFALNGSYNGSGATDLLAASQTLAVGQSKTLRLTVTVTPHAASATYNNQAFGSGRSPANTQVTDPSDNGVNPDPDDDNNANEAGENDPTPVTLAEHPVLGVAKQVVGKVNNGDGTFTVDFSILVRNYGDVQIHNLQVTDDLDLAFGVGKYVVLSKANALGSTLAINAGYNGSSDKNLLGGTDTLPVGGEGTILLSVKVTPGSNLGPYLNRAIGTGNSPVGTPVTDQSQDGPNPDPDNDIPPDPTDNNVPTEVRFDESPKIGIAKRVQTYTANGNGTFTVLFSLFVKNYGDVQISNLQITDNLDATFGAGKYVVNSVANAVGTNFALNWPPDTAPNYDGGADVNLLKGTDVLPKNGSGTIELSVTVTPGVGSVTYLNSATVIGSSPAGTPVTDQSQDGADPDPVVPPQTQPDGEPKNNNQPTPVTYTETPKIGVAKRVFGSVVNNKNGTYDVTYEILVQNIGDVELRNVQVTDDLAVTFAAATSWSVSSVTSSDFTVNWTAGPPPTGYNGGAAPTPNINLLAGSDTLPKLAEGKIRVTVRVVPGTFSGPYDNNATGRGVSPGQVTVSDISTDGIDTDPDTKPGTAPADNLDASDDSVPTPVSFDVASVGDKVWLDIHDATGQFIADGQQQQDEPGIPGVKVNLMQGATLIDSVDTDSSGNYTFRYLPAGSYTVQIDPSEFLSSGTLYQWQVSPQNQGPDSTDSDGSAAHEAGVTLLASTQDATIDFGFYRTASYEVTKTLDTPEPVRIGSEVIFTIRIKNTGQLPILKLPLSDTYQTLYLDYGYGGFYSTPSSTPPSGTADNGTLDWTDLTLGAGLAPGGTVDVVVHFKATKDTTGLTGTPPNSTQNTATVHDATVDPDGAGPLETLTLPASSASDTVQVVTPTGVGVSGFGGVRQGNKVTLTWRTAEEAKLAGFNIRRKSGAGEPALLNSELLYAQNAGANLGAAYSFVDPAAPAGVLTYVLEAVRLDGSVEAVGQIEVKQ